MAFMKASSTTRNVGNYWVFSLSTKKLFVFVLKLYIMVHETKS
jgi:hypothetical protein